MKLISGFSDIRDNKEDFVLTPFLFLVFLRNPKVIKVYGIGLCWFYWSFYVGVGLGKEPKTISKFYDITELSILNQGDVVWGWCEYPAGKEWRELIYDKKQLCLSYRKMGGGRYWKDYSLHSNRRLTQNVKYFCIDKDKPSIIF